MTTGINTWKAVLVIVYSNSCTSLVHCCSNLWIDIRRNIHEGQHILTRPQKVLGGFCQQVCQVCRSIFDLASTPCFQKVLESLHKQRNSPDFNCAGVKGSIGPTGCKDTHLGLHIWPCSSQVCLTVSINVCRVQSFFCHDAEQVICAGTKCGREFCFSSKTVCYLDR